MAVVEIVADVVGCNDVPGLIVGVADSTAVAVGLTVVAVVEKSAVYPDRKWRIGLESKLGPWRTALRGPDQRKQQQRKWHQVSFS